jgi:hypothetical protein
MAKSVISELGDPILSFASRRASFLTEKFGSKLIFLLRN